MPLSPAGKPGLAPGFVLAAASLLCACTPAPPTSATTAAAPQAASGPLRYAELLQSYDEALAAEGPPKAPASADERVRLLLERARLSGDYADYARAGAVIEQADAKATIRCLPLARWHYTLHRLAAAGRVLEGCAAAVDADELAGLRADIAFYSGRYREAEATYREQLNRLDQPQGYIRMALLRARSGAPAEAMALFEAAEQRYHGDSAVMRAWLKLQRGLVALDQGRYEQARALYLAAAEALPGWWLVDEHLAEVQALMGETEAARGAYENIVRRTGAPEFMDALAALEAHSGHGDRAAKLLAQARTLYEQRLAAFPEASAGHALDHYLNSPGEAAVALRLAQANDHNRPYGEAGIALAEALMLNGKATEAVRRLQAEAAAGWDTPELHWVLAQALAQAGQAQQATAERARALAGNPRASSMYGAAPLQLSARSGP
ncbi:tetratricopeptide repeat protein [Solimonas sp. K1W22B-7]|uniref:tetratricopeptide repeat protein n=1 Tax=Solimonas sp. K1W22B-7 TaxID=2303331 RepID=UPI0013C4650F|nr:hypothetical protein [Solimonas sp. K1W22B-7]